MPDVKPPVYRMSPQLYHLLADVACDVFGLRFGAFTREELRDKVRTVRTAMFRIQTELEQVEAAEDGRPTRIP